MTNVQSLPVRQRCPVCGGSGHAWLDKEGRELRHCKPCGLTWVVQGLKLTASGRSIYEEAEPAFFADDQSDYYGGDLAREAAQAKLQWVKQFVPSGARLLDIGANLGLFVSEASHEYDAVGIEPSWRVANWAQRHTGARVQPGSIYDGNILDGPFDVVTLFDVLEHLSDPDQALVNCRKLLHPDGYLFLTTPDAGSLMSRLLRSRWYYIDLDEHILLFSRRSLRIVLERNGFKILSMRTIGRRYVLSYIRRRLQHLGRQTRAMRIAALAAWPIQFWPDAAVPINLGDVVGVVAQRQ